MAPCGYNLDFSVSVILFNTLKLEENHNQNIEETTTAHTTGYGLYILVWFGLVGLTLLTVSVSGLNLASLTVTAAITIAIVKSLLVTNYFMHVRTDTRVFKVFIFVSLVMFLTLIILTFFDITFRAGGK